MPKKNHNNKHSIRVSMKVRLLVCAFCQKALSKKEAEPHLFVCDKVPQEIFNGRLECNNHLIGAWNYQSPWGNFRDELQSRNDRSTH